MATVVIESLPANSGVVHVGAASFVMPWLDFRATPSQIARLEVAAMLESANDQPLTVRQLLAEIEDEMAREHRRRGKIPEGRALRVGADQEIEDGPLALVPAQRLGLPVIRTDQGAVYAPDAYRQQEPRRSAAMEKFDRISPVRPANAVIDFDSLSPDQADLLKKATEKLASAEGRKLARARIVCFRIVGYGRMTQAERDERRFAQNAYAQLGIETGAAHDRAEVKSGRAESFALAGARERAQRREACKALLIHLKLGARRRRAIAAELIEFRATLFEEARAGVLQDVKAGGRRLNRDGLDSLPLSGPQRAAAEWYRGVYERTERGARVAAMGDRVGGEPRDQKAKDWGAEQVARKEVEGRVMAGCRNGRGITALRLVVGEGRTITAISSGKSQNRKLNADALMQAIDIVADYRGLQ
jgi:hypothetical protein